MTKVTTIVLFVIMIISTGNLLAVIKNENKPAKGEWNFELKQEWVIENVGDIFFTNLGTIRVDEDGHIYLLERKYGKVIILNPEGKLLLSFGARGEGPGEFRNPQVPYLVDDYLIIQDIGNDLKFFTKKGEFKKSFKISTNVYPREFIDANHYLTLRRVDPEKNPNQQSLEIYNISDKMGTVIAEVPANDTVSATISHDQGTTTIILDERTVSPSLVTAIYKRSLYVGRNDKYLIKRINLDNHKEELSFSIEGRKGKPVTMADKRKIIQSVPLSGGRTMHPAMAKKLTEGIPNNCTLFDRIYIDENGLIYVYVTDLTNDGGQEMDIFSPEGRYLYHANIKLSNGMRKVRPLVFHHNHMYAFVENEEDDRMLVKYEIKHPVL